MQHTFLRSFRIRHRLSQHDVAKLIGLNRSLIARIETGKTAPYLDLALRLQVLFGAHPSLMFAAKYTAAEDRVMQHVKEEHEALEGKTDEASVHRRQFLEAVAQRARGVEANDPSA